jgi:hypothetical protein
MASRHIPEWGKLAAGLAAIIGLLTILAGWWTSWGGRYPAWRPDYDDLMAKKISGAKQEIEQKVEKVEQLAQTGVNKADRNNLDQLETKRVALEAHESILRAQLTAIKRDPAFAKSFSLQNEAVRIDGHIQSPQQQNRDVQSRIQAERGR